MADQSRIVGSPEWWLRRLETQLAARQAELRRYDEYYEGDHRLLFATAKFREAFAGLFSEFADNWCDLVVDAVEERLNVEGFRLGGKGDESGDKKAWSVWQANHLDAESQVAHTEALICGEAYTLTWAGQDGQPLITVEHPTEVVVAHAPGGRVRTAALKAWVDDDGYRYATLYLPDGLFKFRSRSRPAKVEESGRTRTVVGSRTTWEPREVDGETWPLPNPLGVVPVVPLVNRPRMLRAGVSEIKKVIPLQDAINKLVADMIVASEFGAAPQRWATGLEVPTDPETGQPVAPFKSMVDRMLTSKRDGTRFGEFKATDLTTFVKAIEMLVQHVASQTRTPPHYFYLSGQFPSGESIKSAETGLVAKARRKMRHFGEAWEETMRLAFMVTGDKGRSQVKDSETIWGDPESRTESEHIDAVVKQKALSVPDEMLWERAGYSPQEIERMKAIIAENPPDTGELEDIPA